MIKEMNRIMQEYYFSDYESWDWMIDVNIRGHLNAISKF